MSDDSELTLDEIEEARAEEEFISEPEDTVNNPLVPSAAGGMTISSGNIMHGDFTGGSDKPINNENNMKGEIVGNQEGSIFDKPKATVEPAPAEEGAPIFGKKKEVKQEPAAAPAPAPAPAEQPVATAAPAGAAPKKKSKAGLIITLCIIFALLIGGGVAALLWLMSRESPDTLVNDAVAKMYEAENLNLSSKIDFENENGPSGSFDFKIAKSGENFKLDGTLKTEGESIKIDAIEYKNDTYIKFDGISKIDTESFLKQQSTATTNTQVKMIKGIIKYIGEAVDDNWVKVDFDMFKNFIPQSGNCSLDPQTLLSTDSSKVKDAYKNNAFIKRDDSADVKEENGVKYIKVKIDKEKSNQFIKALMGEGADKCVDSENKEEKESTIILGVKPWSHDLSVVKITDDKGKTYDLDINFDKTDIAKPDNSKSILSLMSDIEKAFKKGMVEYAEDYTKEVCQSAYGAYGSAYVDLCVERSLPTVKAELENMDMQQIFGPMIQSLMGGLSSQQS